MPTHGSRRGITSALALLLGVSAAFRADGQPTKEQFDGSFLLQTGEVVTGGYFVEGGVGRFLYMDTERLAKGGLFEASGGGKLVSIFPPGTVEIEFTANAQGKFDSLQWRESGQEAVPGQRVHAHRSQPVRFASADGTPLQGRLLLPDCPGPHPVIVAVHGSGPVNRFGGAYDLFFLRHGIAVLAYDKRGYTSDQKAWLEPDLAVLSADAVAAVRFAASQPGLDGKRIGLFGSSQAGWVVPPAAMEAAETDFIILRAGAGAPWLETSLHEVRQELRSQGLAGLELDKAMDLRQAIYEVAARGDAIAATDPLVAPWLKETWYQKAFGEGPVSARWSPRWWAWLQANVTADPAPFLAKFQGPVLWFLAGEDENVPLVRTRAALERAFASAPGKDQEIVVLPDALHSFLIPSPEGPPRFSDGFFNRMGRWLAERGYSGQACPADPPVARAAR